METHKSREITIVSQHNKITERTAIRIETSDKTSVRIEDERLTDGRILFSGNSTTSSLTVGALGEKDCDNGVK